MDSAEEMPGLPFSLKWLELVLQPRLSTTAKLIAARPDGVQKGSYVCTTVRMRFTWECTADSKHLPTSVFIKAMKLSNSASDKRKSNSNSQLKWDDNLDMKLMHTNEVNFYLNVRSNCKMVQEVTPTLFYSQLPSAGFVGLVILEDLSSSSSLVDWVSGLNVHQLLSVAKVIGKLQSLSLRRLEWRSKFGKRTYPREVLQNWVDILQNQLAPILWKRFPKHFTVSNSEIEKLRFVVDAMFDAVETAKNYGPTVLCHGDLWSNNILFRRSVSGHVANDVMAVIDWQACSYSLPGEDLAYLMPFSCETNLRRAETERVLQTYANQFEPDLGVEFGGILKGYMQTVVLGTLALAVTMEMEVDRLEPEKLGLLVSRLNANIEDCCTSV